ncbi:hypothetical protein B7992_11775 [Fibrobacter sp. UWH1]|nr:hypothetical protein B7992_11775 [Fibrobacter sp. UWH1]
MICVLLFTTKFIQKFGRCQGGGAKKFHFANYRRQGAMFWALPWRAGPLALSTRDASRSFSLARPATAQGKRRASPTPCGLRGLTRKRCGTGRDVFLEGFHVGFRRCVYANLALLKDADFVVLLYYR